jgi:hypothetical protein
MGDRCSIHVNIHGHIETVEAMKAAIAAIETEGLNTEHHRGEPDAAIMAEFMHNVGGDNAPQFHNHECNYADIGALETVLREQGIAYSGGHSEGAGFPAMRFAFYPGDGYYEAVDDGTGASVLLANLKRAVKAEQPLDAVNALIGEADKANGTGMPVFTVSESVLQFLKGEDEEASSPAARSDLRTYSVIINWNDRDQEQGTFGTTVRAANHDEAEALARKEMRMFHVNNYGDDSVDEYEDNDGTFGGSVVECSEGAAWKAVEMEAALRRLIAGSTDDISEAMDHAHKIIAEIDGKGEEH